MYFYTNIFQKGNNLYIRGYKDGKRVSFVEKNFKPYIFVKGFKTKTDEYKTIYGKNVSRLDFESIQEANDFIKRYRDVENIEFYGLTNFKYLYLYENFKKDFEYDLNLIKTLFFDIEVDSSSGFPNIQTANKQITAITIICDKEKVILGLKDLHKKIKNVRYYKCSSEEDLLNTFLSLWNSPSFSPDIITGWNIEFFDIPYIVNRIRRVLGENEANKLSPWGILREKKIIKNGKEETIYIPVGIDVLDYYAFYKNRKFKQEQLESYKLEYVAEVENLPIGKLNYKDLGYKNLADLYERNFDLFIEYNLKDVEVVKLLEEKMKFIELTVSFAYDVRMSYEDIHGSLIIWDILIHNYLMDNKIVVPFNNKKQPRNIEGGYVKDVKPGLYKWNVSFDVTSLYPSLIMSFNISNETKLGMIDVNPNDVFENGYLIKNKKDGVCYSFNGLMTDRKNQGFLSLLSAKMFAERKKYKEEMLETKRQYEENKNNLSEKEKNILLNKISKYKNMQFVRKIALNSLYGSLANEYFRWYDPDLAEAITKNGQNVIKFVAREINIYLNKLLKTQNEDYVIAIDTDSCIITLEKMVEKISTSDKEKILNAIDKFCEEKLQKIIEQGFEKLYDIVNISNKKLHMKREVISDKAIWKAKKMYIMNVLDNEGVRYKDIELKITGIEAIRSSTPKICREEIKKILVKIFSENEESVQKEIEEFEKRFNRLLPEDVAFIRTATDITKYNVSDTDFTKGTPIHIRGCIVYNRLVKKHNLNIPLIENLDKIKFLYLKENNPSGSHVISFIDKIPEEFGLKSYVDYDKQFEVLFLSPIRALLEIVGWKEKKVSTLEEFFG